MIEALGLIAIVYWIVTLWREDQDLKLRERQNDRALKALRDKLRARNP